MHLFGIPGNFWSARRVILSCAGILFTASFQGNEREAWSAEDGTKPASSAQPGSTAVNEGSENKEPFEFDYYETLMNPLETRQRERLCGLDKVCIELWRKGKLQINKEGRLFSWDFNGDGKADEAVILEEDDEDDPASKNYLVYITTTSEDGKTKILFHELLPEAHNVIDVFVDKTKNALVIDTGGRIVRTQTHLSYGYDGAYYQSGQTLKVVVVVHFDPKLGKFQSLVPTNVPIDQKKKKH